MRTERHDVRTDRKTADVTKLIAHLHNFATVPKKQTCLEIFNNLCNNYVQKKWAWLQQNYSAQTSDNVNSTVTCPTYVTLHLTESRFEVGQRQHFGV